MIWQVSQFCKPKIGTKIECPPILYKSIFRLRHYKKQIWVCITGAKSVKAASEGANYVPFSAKLQTK